MEKASEQKRIKVGVVENEEHFRNRVSEILEAHGQIELVRGWESAETFWRDPEGESLDMIFLDIRLHHMDGVELAGMISGRNPEIQVIMLSNMKSDDLIFRALRNGAVGYLLKSELDNIQNVIDITLAGGAIISPTIALRVLHSFRKSGESPESPLTPKEHQILDEMACGKTIPKVADFLGISKYTVQYHVKNIYRKLNVNTRAGMVRKAADMGLLE